MKLGGILFFGMVIGWYTYQPSFFIPQKYELLKEQVLKP